MTTTQTTRIAQVRIVRNHTLAEQAWAATRYVVEAWVSKGRVATLFRHPDADYYTGDKQDAITTAKCMLDMGQSPYTLRVGVYYTQQDLRP